VRAVLLRRTGGPEVLEPGELPDPRPGPGEVLLRVAACAVNRVDLDLRSGSARLRPGLPHVLGREAAGTVLEVGPGAGDWRPGQRALVLPVWPCGRCELCLAGSDNLCPEARQPGISAQGCYAELVVAPARHLFELGAGLDDVHAAAALVSFGTAWRLLVTLARVSPGESVLVTGAGGGLGRAAVQVAALRGARVIAAASGPAKLAGLAELGASELVDYGSRPLAAAVRELTGGAGVEVAVEQAGGDLFAESLRSLRQGGRLVVAGAHAGRSVGLDLAALYLNEWRILGSRSQRREELEAVFELVAAGSLRPQVAAVLPLDAAAEAHGLLEGRGVAGKLVLKP
jgi:NADPH:quinone reductase-like Zn-dependent oxidoreductase